jgi:acyl-[acyl carrier protein]--UDP-N-acetylglucosamine O-acyltransferase
MSSSKIEVMSAFRFIFKSKTPIIENAKALAAKGGLDENVQAIVDCLLKSSLHRHGRYLRIFKKKTLI